VQFCFQRSHLHVSINIPGEKFVEISLNGGVDSEQSGDGGKDEPNQKPNQKRTKTELKRRKNVLLS
jgi:hypothetical protein